MLSTALETAEVTSWIPVAGEVLGGLASLGGLIAAGVGLYDEVVGENQESEAEKTSTSFQKPAINVAGTFIAPQQRSVSV